MKQEMTHCCVILPAYQEGAHISAVIKGVLPYCPNVVVVDDGSSDDTAACAKLAGAAVVKHDVNRGKGAALDSGFTYAREQGVEFVVTMDADGQHAPEDLPVLMAAQKETGASVIVGNRMGHPGSMPFVRKCTNRFMSWLLSRKMKQRVPDTQSGYRLYALEVVEALSLESGGFAAESEILMDLSHRGVRIASAPIQVIYGDEKSKIHPIRDTIRFFRMLREYRPK